MGISDKINDEALYMMIGDIKERSRKEFDRLGVKISAR